MSEKTSEKTKIKLNTPNKLTIFRILLVPVMVIVSFIQFPGDLWGIKTQWIILDVLFIIGSLTDHWDGHLARKNNQITTFGKFLDPIADKILVISTMIAFIDMAYISSIAVIIIIIREFLVTSLRLVAASDNLVIAASKLGKLKTVIQMIVLTVMFFTPQIVNLSGFLPITILEWIMVIITVVSGADYLIKNKHVITTK